VPSVKSSKVTDVSSSRTLFPFDAEVASKIESGIEPKAPEYRRRIVGVPQGEGGTYLEVERATRGPFEDANEMRLPRRSNNLLTFAEK
jgi:hypothetical protein